MCFRCFVVMYKFWIFIYLSVEEGDDIKELHVFLLVFDRETPMKKLFGKVFWARGNVRTRGWDYNSQSWTVKGLHLVSWTELKIVFLTNFSGRIYLCCCLVGKILFWLFQVVRGTPKRDLGGQINSRFMLRMIGSSEVVLPHLVVGTNVYKAENE